MTPIHSNPVRTFPRVGDKIRRSRGNDPQTVYKVDYHAGLVWATYDKSGEDYYENGQFINDIVVIEEGKKEMTKKLYGFDDTVIIKEKGKDEMTKQLYEFKVEDKTAYGYKLAVNSAGLWVMDVKGSDVPVAVDKETVKEVVPYTVDVEFLGSFNTYSYTAKEGDWKVGDLAIVNEGLATVKAINTKAKSATKDLSEEATGKVMLDTSFKS